ncbi:MAG: GMC oxidoreductase [Spirochaetota bacterium]
MESTNFDLIVIGAGMGGSALTWALRDSDLRIAVLDRGGPLKQEAANWSPDEVIANRRYEQAETWYDEHDQPFTPRIYYNYGGSSKFFGGSAFRFRERDFSSHQFPEGKTVSWPLSYKDLSGYYDIAEEAMHIHGQVHADPTEPPIARYPHAPLEHEPSIAWLENRLQAQGLKPFNMPSAVHQGDGGHCQKGSPCDGFPCKIRAKYDAENAFLRPALKANKTITMFPNTKATQILHDANSQRATGVKVIDSQGTESTLSAKTIVLAAGTVHSAALLLASATDQHPHGLANMSDQVGRNFMSHNNSVLMALSPFRKNSTWFQKTLALNDFYLDGGNVQTRGKILPQNLEKSGTFWMRQFSHAIAARSFDFWVMSEDLPDPENRVELRSDGSIRLTRRLNNLQTHTSLVRRVKQVLRRAGLPIILERPPSPSTIQHQVGTLRMGEDPKHSVVAPAGHTHEVENLYVVDGSVFPSSAAVNPSVTIAANAIRVADTIRNA